MSEEKRQKMLDSYVSYYIFFWACGIATAAIGFSVAMAVSAKIDVGSVKTSVETQKTDVQWIKETLIEIKGDIKTIKSKE